MERAIMLFSSEICHSSCDDSKRRHDSTFSIYRYDFASRRWSDLGAENASAIELEFRARYRIGILTTYPIQYQIPWFPVAWRPCRTWNSKYYSARFRMRLGWGKCWRPFSMGHPATGRLRLRSTPKCRGQCVDWRLLWLRHARGQELASDLQEGVGGDSFSIAPARSC
jgi:hypothetical protein